MFTQGFFLQFFDFLFNYLKQLLPVELLSKPNVSIYSDILTLNTRSCVISLKSNLKLLIINFAEFTYYSCFACKLIHSNLVIQFRISEIPLF